MDKNQGEYKHTKVLGVPVVIRNVDGYIRVNGFFDFYHKKYHNWRAHKKTYETTSSVSRLTNIDWNELYGYMSHDSKQIRGYYVHPKLLHNVISYCCKGDSEIVFDSLVNSFTKPIPSTELHFDGSRNNEMAKSEQIRSNEIEEKYNSLVVTDNRYYVLYGSDDELKNKMKKLQNPRVLGSYIVEEDLSARFIEYIADYIELDGCGFVINISKKELLCKWNEDW